VNAAMICGTFSCYVGRSKRGAKILQLCRAVALSDDQLENRRLTVAQDIDWALINSPAFSYDH